MKKINYQRELRDSGEDIEVVGWHKIEDERITESSPTYTDEIDKIIKIMEERNIMELTIRRLKR